MTHNQSEKTRITNIAQERSESRASRAGESCIVVIYGPELGRRVPLAFAPFEIGRSTKNDLFIDQESISRHHARITFEGTGYVIRDLGSTNGTFVNDEALREARLKDGDQVQIGRSILKFMTGENIEVQYHEEIYRLMTVDGLTQAFNRRYFDEAMEREFNRSRRYGRALSLILFDIDHFKRINDTWGHLAGDAMLRQLVAAVRPRLRREDMFCRTGGEEFAILLPEIAVDGAALTAEKVRRIVETAALRHEQTVIPCTISLGVGEASDVDELPTGLYSRTDEALYAAKGAGRNRVVIAP
ncbi:MAG: GGDEF domain-containing protein [Myxococcales bacterium]